jgi:hypothetical protein
MLPDYCEATSISSKCIAACLGITYQTGLTSRGEAGSDRVATIQRPISLLANESPVEQPLPLEQLISIPCKLVYSSLIPRTRASFYAHVALRCFPQRAIALSIAVPGSDVYYKSSPESFLFLPFLGLGFVSSESLPACSFLALLAGASGTLAMMSARKSNVSSA